MVLHLDVDGAFEKFFLLALVTKSPLYVAQVC